MKDFSKTAQEGIITGVKLGIVRLGRAAGKLKYTLLDESDINLVQEYAFEARIQVDKDGNGVQIFAFAYDIRKGRYSGQFLQDLLWEKHQGGIAPGFKVIHINGLTMDNRLENLAIVPKATKQVTKIEQASSKQREQLLYWAAIQQLPADPEVDDAILTNSVAKFLGDHCGDDGEEGNKNPTSFYECHYPPCSNMEQEPREFSICGRCQAARYCGTPCQQRDWPSHKRFCRENPQIPIPPLYMLRETPPER